MPPINVVEEEEDLSSEPRNSQVFARRERMTRAVKQNRISIMYVVVNHVFVFVFVIEIKKVSIHHNTSSEPMLSFYFPDKEIN